jgi:folate-dependent phosphoribosylglycinamide formyltransferase PurN
MKGISKLQEKWGVGSVQFWLIILTFALGGSLSGRLTSFLIKLVILEKNWAFWLIYPLLLTILWPISVLFVSLFTGQFRFFKGYLGRVASKLMGFVSNNPTVNTPIVNTNATNVNSNAPIHVALFASGAGSNARKIIEYFENGVMGQSTGAEKNSITRGRIKISLIVCNVPGAGVLEIAKEKGIPTLLINKREFSATGYVESLRNADIHFIVLAGFLWKVPSVLVNAFKPQTKIDAQGNIARGIINIHPALLPKYGGKGMYGTNVHEAVIAAGEKESGITIHWVNEHYDEGAIIFQAKCVVEFGDTPTTLANKIHALEHAHFAPTIEKLLK